MKIEKICMALVAILLVIPLTSNGAKSCNCGSLVSGVLTEYYVDNDADCCRDIAHSLAFQDTYVSQGNGAYVHTGTEEIDGTDAQNDCCPET